MYSAQVREAQGPYAGERGDPGDHGRVRPEARDPRGGQEGARGAHAGLVRRPGGSAREAGKE